MHASRTRTTRAMIVRLAMVASVFVGHVDTTFGQAWIGPKGSGSINLDAQFVEGDGLLVNGQNLAPFKGVGFHNRVVTANLEYVPFDKWAIKAEVPYQFGQLKGPPGFDNTAFGRLLGDGHTSDQILTDLSDLAMELRRGFTYKDWALAPFVGFSIPMTNYEIHTARQPGRGLSEARIGLNAGHKLGEKAYLHLRYMFSHFDTFGERADFALEDKQLQQTNAALELGYFVNKKITVKGGLNYRNTKGGIECADAITFGGRILGGVANADDVRGFLFHRALRNEEFITARIEGEYNLSDHWSTYVGYSDFVSGNDIIPFTSYWTTGVTWSFE